MTLTPMQLVAEAQAQVRQVDVAGANHHIAAGSAVIDVREPAEYGMGHLPGAINLPRGVIEFKIGDIAALTNKEQPLILYCKTGGRAALAAVNLQRMGYSNVKSITGGFDAWVASGQKTETV